MIKKITKLLLFSVIAITPFLMTKSLYFPYVSGKVYVFRLLVMLAFFFWVWLMLKEKEHPSTSLGTSRPNFKNLLVIAVILFFLAQVLVSFFGVDSALSFFSTIERGDGVLQYGFWVLYFLMLISVLRSKKDWQIFLGAFLMIAFLISLYSWFNYQKQSNLYGIFGNPAYLGSFLIFAIGFTAIIFQERTSHYSAKAGDTGQARLDSARQARRVSLGKKHFPYFNLIFFPLILFFILTLIFTQIRGAYAGLAGGLGLFILLTILFLRKEKKKLIICLILFSIIGLISVGLIFAYKESQFVKNYRILRRIAEVSQPWETPSVKLRILTWQIAVKSFQDKPIFGWGPENFQSAFNKHYNYQIGLEQPWFDRTHNQPLEILATGGIVLFSFYLFWLGVVIYLIFKISREKKTLSFILISIFLAYFLQGLFLFDILPTYLGLFPFLGFLVFQYNSIYRVKKEEPFDALRQSSGQAAQGKQKKKNNFNNRTPLYILIPTACLVLFVIYTTSFIPYRANALALKCYAYTENGIYRGIKSLLEQSYAIKSPYTFWEVRKRTGWQFANIFEYSLNSITNPDDVRSLEEIYDFITPELERFVENKPYDPQIYYVLGRMYRLGFEKLGKEDLDKAENVLKKSLNYSQYRIEYFNELARVLILQGKFEEAEDLIRDYTKRIGSDYPFSYVTLGHLYFVEEKYDLAMPEYQKAKEKGYEFWRNSEEYNRYLLTAEKLGDYQKIVEICQEYLENRGPNADTFFNLAIAYRELKDFQKAEEFFLKALEINSELEEYRIFFAP